MDPPGYIIADQVVMETTLENNWMTEKKKIDFKKVNKHKVLFKVLFCFLDVLSTVTDFVCGSIFLWMCAISPVHENVV